MLLGVLDTGHPLWAVDTAPRVEYLGYSRYWLGEHHGHEAQSGSPEVLTGVVAALTRRIRVGPAGVLLRYYSPYKVAQDTRLLDEVFHPRVDLGVARGAGGGGEIAVELLEGRDGSTEAYEAKVRALALLLGGSAGPDGAALAATLGSGRPFQDFWVLGASPRAARLAGSVGASFGFSEYFARMVDPDTDGAAVIRAYRTAFQPSAGRDSPRWNVAVAGAAVPRGGRRPETLTMEGPAPMVAGVAAWRRRLAEVTERYETDEVIFFDLCTRIADRRRSLEVMAEAGDLTPAP